MPPPKLSMHSIWMRLVNSALEIFYLSKTLYSILASFSLLINQSKKIWVLRKEEGFSLLQFMGRENSKPRQITNTKDLPNNKFWIFSQFKTKEGKWFSWKIDAFLRLFLLNGRRYSKERNARTSFGQKHWSKR